MAIPPASAFVAAGQTRGTFAITTRVVALETVAILTATAGSDRRQAALRVVTITSPPLLQDVEIEASLTSGQTAIGTVRLAQSIATSTFVSLRSNDAALIVPSSLAVRAGERSATFFISTRPVTEETFATVTASAGFVDVRTAVVLLKPSPPPP